MAETEWEWLREGKNKIWIRKRYMYVLYEASCSCMVVVLLRS